MKDSDWLEKEYKRLNKAIDKVKQMRAETIQEVKFARMNGEDDNYLFSKWVNLDRQLYSIKGRRDLVYKIWKL